MSENHIFKVGDPVYIPNYDRIDQGRVLTVHRVNIDSTGIPQRDDNGSHILTTALFGIQYYQQVYCEKFFPDLPSARKKLKEILESIILSHERNIQRIQEKIQNIDSEGVTYVYNDRNQIVRAPKNSG